VKALEDAKCGSALDRADFGGNGWMKADRLQSNANRLCGFESAPS
jgi:hypothetical protein